MAELAGSLGLDSQVHVLLNGDPLERAVARVVVRGALKARQTLDQNLGAYVARAIAGGKEST